MCLSESVRRKTYDLTYELISIVKCCMANQDSMVGSCRDSEPTLMVNWLLCSQVDCKVQGVSVVLDLKNLDR